MSQITDTGCCPRFDPTPWQGNEVTWTNKAFAKDRVRSLLHIPLNFGAVMTRLSERIKAANATMPNHLTLTDENSLWGADVYTEIANEAVEGDIATLSGTFVTRVFEGPFSQIGQWIKQTRTELEAEGKPPKRILNWYTTCPKCAKAYGENYVVLFAEV